jgi:hypothetical protein
MTLDEIGKLRHLHNDMLEVERVKGRPAKGHPATLALAVALVEHATFLINLAEREVRSDAQLQQ